MVYSRDARTSPTRGEHARTATIDLAGTAWPIYKLEAVAAAFLTFVLVAALTTAMQPAVLTAAAVAVLVWCARRPRSAPRDSAREAARSE
ncbi:hypothetical protein [Rhodococcus sp. HNM0569]|uniref:hypothetical protein n=1 Tax=Rhodococcus sp. HNM0569 TaxID=2716340 RepID=UPI00146F5F79|nr:hypothetical protein [Rhodococcus sp. HNM0569]NLU82940.1 hypothetical protein [Rhodococcus sp. HNM0569]